MTTKDWQSVDRSNVSWQTFPKMPARYRKHPCTKVERRTGGMRRWLDDAKRSDKQIRTSTEWVIPGILERCRAALGGPRPPLWIEYALGCVANAATSELWIHCQIAGVRRSDELKHWAATANVLPSLQAHCSAHCSNSPIERKLMLRSLRLIITRVTYKVQIPL